MKPLDKNETELRGQISHSNGVVLKSDSTSRIEWLINNSLIYIAADYSGWEKLYWDELYDRYWELTYPLSEMHGGGPPSLMLIPKEKAIEKYLFAK